MPWQLAFYQYLVGIITTLIPKTLGARLLFTQNLQQDSLSLSVLHKIKYSFIVSRYHFLPCALIALFFLFLGSLGFLASFCIEPVFFKALQQFQMQQMQEQHGNQIRNLQGIHNQELEAKDKEISRLNTILEKAFNWFPLLKEMLRMEKLCYVIGFTKGMVDSLLYKREALRCSGKIYSEEYRQRFETKNVIFKIERSPIDKNKLMLTINQQPISKWFKEQWEILRQGLRQSAEESRKSRGFKM